MIEMSRMFQVSVSRDHAVRRVEPDERRAGDAQHGLEILADVRAILRVHRARSPRPSGARHHATS